MTPKCISFASHVPLLIALLLFFTGCSRDRAKEKPPPWQMICCRDVPERGLLRHPLYRTRVPIHWQQVSYEGSISDTRLPIAEWRIPAEEGFVTVVVHNFPTQRIPPIIQIRRWLEQLKPSPLSLSLKEIVQNGYRGYFLEGANDTECMVAWALQVGFQHYSALQGEGFFRQQMAADVTIKVKGPPLAIEKEKRGLLIFGNSFETLDPFPLPEQTL